MVWLQGKIVEIVATGMYGYIKFVTQDQGETYIPPTKKDAIEQYKNDPFFNKAVNCIIDRLISEEIYIKDSCP